MDGQRQIYIRKEYTHSKRESDEDELGLSPEATMKLEEKFCNNNISGGSFAFRTIMEENGTRIAPVTHDGRTRRWNLIEIL